MASEQVVLNERFLVMLAHELRNPLAPIKNSIHVIEQIANDNRILKNCAEVLNRQLNYLVNIIDDLLDVARVLRGELELNKEYIEIGSVIKQAVHDMEPIITARKHLFEVTIPETKGWIIGDAEKLKKVLHHLINNAAKITETGGKINLTANYSNNSVNINIKDTGVEINSEILSLLPDSRTASNMGVALANEIVSLHKGTIETHNSANNGNEFTILLPLEAVNDDASEDVFTFRNEFPDKSLEILVVDDHIDTAESLAVLLKMWGHTVHVCHSGYFAVKFTKELEPDVILMDIGLPDCDGYQVAKTIKSEFPEILMIAISGYGQTTDYRRSTQAGFQRHLIKPVTPAKIKEILHY
jgi:CheY-like chemotaxis protein